MLTQHLTSFRLIIRTQACGESCVRPFFGSSRQLHSSFDSSLALE
jgi:hypothetical protein